MRQQPNNSVCPITQEKLNVPIFKVVHENGTVIGYSLSMLIMYIIQTGSHLEPTTRRPFNRIELTRMDRMARDAGLCLPSVVSAVFDPVKQLQVIANSRASEVFDDASGVMNIDLDNISYMIMSKDKYMFDIGRMYIFPSFKTHALISAAIDKTKTLHYIDKRIEQMKRMQFRFRSNRTRIISFVSKIRERIYALRIPNVDRMLMDAVDDMNDTNIDTSDMEDCSVSTIEEFMTCVDSQFETIFNDDIYDSFLN